MQLWLVDIPGIWINHSLLNWITLGVFSIFLGWGLVRVNRAIGSQTTAGFHPSIFIAAIPFCAMFLGINLMGGLNIPGSHLRQVTITAMILCALPWMAAVYLLPLRLSMMIAGLSGAVLALFQTHDLFTILIWILSALIYLIVTYNPIGRGDINGVFHPLLGAVISSVMLIPIVFLVTLLAAGGTLLEHLGLAFTTFWAQWGAYSIPLVVGGGLLSGLALINHRFKSGIVQIHSTQKSPRHLGQTLAVTACLIFTVVLALISMFWRAQQTNILEERSSQTSDQLLMIEDGLRNLDAVGRNLIRNFAEELVSSSSDEKEAELEEMLRQVPFFTDLYLVDAAGGVVAHTANHLPDDSDEFWQQLQQHLAANLPVSGFIAESSPVDQFVFLGGGSDGLRGTLVGVTNVVFNPFGQLISNAISGLDGDWLLTDSVGHEIYSTINEDHDSMIPREFIPGEITVIIDQKGELRYQIAQHSKNGEWYLVRSFSNHGLQLEIWNAQKDILILSALLTLGLFMVAGFVILMIQNDWIQDQEGFFSQSGARRPLGIGLWTNHHQRLNQGIESIQNQYQRQIEHLEQLLHINEVSIGGKKLDEGLRSVLEIAVEMTGSDSVRLILDEYYAPILGLSKLYAIGAGKRSREYTHLDRQIMRHTTKKGVFEYRYSEEELQSASKGGKEFPQAWIGYGLRNRERFFGVVWLAVSGDPDGSVSTNQKQQMQLLQDYLSAMLGQCYILQLLMIEHDQFSSLLNAIPEPVLIFDTEARLVYLNESAKRSKSLLKPDGKLGQKIDQAVESQELVELLRQVRGQQTISKQLRLQNGNVYSASAALIRSQATAQEWLMCSLNDVTQYQEMDEIKTDFMETVGQYLRSPLKMTNGYLTMLKMMGNLNPAQLEYIDNIEKSVDNMENLVNNLLGFDRVSAGAHLRFERIYGLDLVKEVVDRIHPQARQRRVTLDITGAPTRMSTMMEGDADLLRQAIYNVVDNAVKYNSIGGKVDIQVELKPSTILFEIHDTGRGISPVDLPHIFSKYYMGGKNNEDVPSMGLPLVKSIIERHHGRVWVESLLGSGSVFYLELPYLQPQNHFH